MAIGFGVYWSRIEQGSVRISHSYVITSLFRPYILAKGT